MFHMAGSETTILEQDLAGRIAQALEALDPRQQLAAQLKAATVAYVRESGYNASAASLSLSAATNQPELITSIVVSCPGASTLFLGGDVQLYFGQAGTFVLAPVEFLLIPTDQRTLEAQSSGAIALVLSGKQVPQYGYLRS